MHHSMDRGMSEEKKDSQDRTMSAEQKQMDDHSMSGEQDDSKGSTVHIKTLVCLFKRKMPTFEHQLSH